MPPAMPAVSMANPIAGGTAAPPETAVMTSPEIWLVLSGLICTAFENIIGKMQEHRNPTAPMQAMLSAGCSTDARSRRTTMQNMMFALKYFISEILVMRNVPMKAPIVRQKKYTCGALPASSLLQSKRMDMIFELMKLVETSTPTTKNMPRNRSSIRLSARSMKVSFSCAPPSTSAVFSSRAIGVSMSQMPEISVMAPSIGKQ